VLDVFDKDQMTEPSIIRARRHSGAADSPIADWRALPIADKSQDAVFLMLSAHEFRTRQSRLVFFREVTRVLRPGGTVILAEHLRDAANFLAFGPGFLHFWPRREWLTVAASTGLKIIREQKITPWVSVFAFERMSEGT
jgi:SAM-dependent methyltransferase